MIEETKHSPEPWRFESDPPETNWVEVHDAHGDSVAARDTCGAFFEEADARRIVACVNACAGLSTEALEAGRLGEALKALLDVHEGMHWNDGPEGLVSGWWHHRTDTAELHGRMLAALRALGRLP